MEHLKDWLEESEKSFHEALEQDLAHDWRGTSHEHWESMMRYFVSDKVIDELDDFVRSIRQRELEKTNRLQRFSFIDCSSQTPFCFYRGHL